MLVPEVMLVFWPKDKLTRFEVARIIGARALQIALGAPVLIKVKEDRFDSTALAAEEFKACKIPMTIRRTLPNGQVIIVDIKPAIKNWLDDHHGKI